MKVVAYGIKPHEKILLAKVNRKMHDITIIANDLTLNTVNYAEGKNALVLTNFHSLTTQIIDLISAYGISQIISWNSDTENSENENVSKTNLSVVHLLKIKDDETSAIQLVRKTIDALNNCETLPTFLHSQP